MSAPRSNMTSFLDVIFLCLVVIVINDPLFEIKTLKLENVDSQEELQGAASSDQKISNAKLKLDGSVVWNEQPMELRSWLDNHVKALTENDIVWLTLEMDGAKGPLAPLIQLQQYAIESQVWDRFKIPTEDIHSN